MRLILHRHRKQDHHDKENHREEKKGRKILKKMAKLERRLRKYNFKETTSSGKDSPASSRSTSRSRSPSRSRNKRTSCRRGKQERRFDVYEESRGDSDNSDSDLSSSASSRSVSGQESRRRRVSRSLPRSRSFTGSDNYSPAPLARRHTRHRHSHRLQHREHLRHRYQNGILGCLFRMLSQSEPDVQSASTEVRKNVAVHEPTYVSDVMSKNTNETVQEANAADAELRVGNSARGKGSVTETDRILSEDSLEIIRHGLPLDAKKYLLKKYRTGESCALLNGPEVNEEILAIARKNALRRDVVQMYEQNQIGAGLIALGQAISDLNDKAEIQKDQDIIDILETLNEAAALFLDAHHNVTVKRQLQMLPELNRRAKAIVKNCKADEWLYGQDFGEKIKNAKSLGKGRKGWRNQRDKLAVAKHRDNGAEELRKHLDSSDLYNDVYRHGREMQTCMELTKYCNLEKKYWFYRDKCSRKTIYHDIRL